METHFRYALINKEEVVVIVSRASRDDRRLNYTRTAAASDLSQLI